MTYFVVLCFCSLKSQFFSFCPFLMTILIYSLKVSCIYISILIISTTATSFQLPSHSLCPSQLHVLFFITTSKLLSPMGAIHMHIGIEHLVGHRQTFRKLVSTHYFGSELLSTGLYEWFDDMPILFSINRRKTYCVVHVSWNLLNIIQAALKPKIPLFQVWNVLELQA